jgi:DNA-directed RNA polymerase subunit K/omega
MVARPVHLNPYEFVAVSALRAKQLLAGCTPRLEGDHSPATMAQMEVAAGCITRADVSDTAQSPQCGWQL